MSGPFGLCRYAYSFLIRHGSLEGLNIDPSGHAAQLCPHGSEARPPEVLQETNSLVEEHMMKEMMGDGMMWGMGVGGLIALAVLVLLVAALVKYVFFR